MAAGDLTQRTRRRGRWPWLSLLPFGLGSWAPVIAGVRCHRVGWTLIGLFWPALMVTAVVVEHGQKVGSTANGAATLLLFAAWIGGIATSFTLRTSYERHLPDPPPGPRPPTQPTLRSRHWSVRYALAAFVLTFAIGFGLSAALDFGLDVRVRVGAGVLILDALLLGTLLPLRRRRGLSRQDLGLRAAPGARSVVFVACGLIAYVTFSALWALGVLHEHASKGPLTGVRHESTVDIVLAVIAATVSAPVVEEIFFRGLLYRSLRNRLPVLPATVIAGAIFGAAHISVYHPSELPVLAVFGCIACQLYERTGSLLPGIALHSFVDSSGIDIELAGNDLIVIAVFGLLAVTLLVRASAARPPSVAHLGVPGAP